MSTAQTTLEYLASPYSDPSPLVRSKRAVLAARNAAALIAEGRRIYSPIAYYLALDRFGLDLPDTWEFWRPHTEAILPACRNIVVLMIDGWDKSIGVRAEIAMAKRHAIPVYYVNPIDEEA